MSARQDGPDYWVVLQTVGALEYPRAVAPTMAEAVAFAAILMADRSIVASFRVVSSEFVGKR